MGNEEWEMGNEQLSGNRYEKTGRTPMMACRYKAAAASVPVPGLFPFPVA